MTSADHGADHKVDLSVRLGPLTLEHPLINGSGTLDLFEAADSLGRQLLDDPPVAAYVPKTVTLQARRGNEPPRIAESAAGMLNSIGLPNEGLPAFIEKDLPRLLALPRPIIVNVGGFAPLEYAQAAAMLRVALDDAGGASGDWTSRVGLELNVSCPNVHSGCMSIGSDPEETAETVAGVRAVWPGLLIAKLTPNVTDIVPIAQAAEKAGVDALSLVNTFKGMVIDRDSLKPYLGAVTGGLSGPAIKPLALRLVFDVYEAVRVPIIGMGGVVKVEDVLDFMACGASVVAVGAAGFNDPWLYQRLSLGLDKEVTVRGLGVRELVGYAHLGHRPVADSYRVCIE